MLSLPCLNKHKKIYSEWIFAAYLKVSCSNQNKIHLLILSICFSLTKFTDKKTKKQKNTEKWGNSVATVFQLERFCLEILIFTDFCSKWEKYTYFNHEKDQIKLLTALGILK